MRSFARWFFAAIPRAPRRAGVLMRLFYRWQENFTSVGHAAAALMLFSMFAGAIPGFWAAWIFAGLDFIFFLALVPSLFLTSKKCKVTVSGISVTPVTEGCDAQVLLHVESDGSVDAISAGCFRMDPSLKLFEGEPVSLKARDSAFLQCKLRTKYRGAFKIPKVAVLVPEINGVLRLAKGMGSAELLVFPRPNHILSLNFLTAGNVGAAFALLLMPNFSRGLNFVGVREYCEGDSLRDLHHKAFARYGRPFTKEFESERGAGCVLVLDVSARNLVEKSLQEPLIRLGAGIAFWLMERGILGRFFIGDDEIPLLKANDKNAILEALARIPHAKIYGPRPKSCAWSPAARPMGPVLKLGLFSTRDPLVQKQIVVVADKCKLEARDESTLFVLESKLNEAGVSL